MAYNNGYYIDKTGTRNNVPEIEVLDTVKYCKYCGSRIDTDAVFCSECGRRLSSEDPQRDASGRVFVSNTTFSSNTTVNNNTSNINYTTVNIGTQPGASAPQPEYMPVRYGRRVDKWAAFLLCLFLGPIGAHKFYEGKTGMGLLYLFTGGLLGIGWIADLLIILGKSDPYWVN